MKKITAMICAAACAVSVVPFSAVADDNDKIYGTMNIPYADFYAAEIDNAYTVDAVSSATQSKWAMNEPGKLVAGTYNDGNGTILGVTYPVEINAADAEALAGYDFKQLDSKPAAYKEISLDGDTFTVSKVIDTNGEQTVDGSAEVSTTTRYGDYQLNVTGYPEETDLCGVIVNTKEGDKYALRHLENIWRAGQLAWSAGISTTESHGNTLKYDNYAGSMGKTVTSVTFITNDGYTTVNVGENYLPVKFAGEVKAEDSAAGSGKTALTLTGFPEDYVKVITIGDGFTVSGTEINYTDAKPGKYTVSVTDESGKYAPMSGEFTLTTADIPVRYEDGKLVNAEGFTEEDAANFISNISSIEVNGNTFSATGRGAVKAVAEDGTIDLNAESRNGKVFDGSGNYIIKVTAEGYTSPLEFEIKAESPATTEAPTSATTPASTTKTTASATTKSSTPSASKTDSPKTGVPGAAIPASALALAAISAFMLRKKND